MFGKPNFWFSSRIHTIFFFNNLQVRSLYFIFSVFLRIYTHISIRVSFCTYIYACVHVYIHLGFYCIHIYAILGFRFICEYMCMYFCCAEFLRLGFSLFYPSSAMFFFYQIAAVPFLFIVYVAHREGIAAFYWFNLHRRPANKRLSIFSLHHQHQIREFS